MVTFRVDAIAQEPNETFTLVLDPVVAPTPREGLFFQETVQVTIVDSDRKDELLDQITHNDVNQFLGLPYCDI